MHQNSQVPPLQSREALPGFSERLWLFDKNHVRNGPLGKQEHAHTFHFHPKIRKTVEKETIAYFNNVH
jgi:hypothetical protein